MIHRASSTGGIRNAFLRRIAIALVALWGMAACSPQDESESGVTGGDGEVVIYTSVDRQFSEPVLEQFEADTGITLRAQYDVEAAKTTGLINRLREESDRPRADVWWNGEFAQTVSLAEEGILAPYAAEGTEGLPDGYIDSDDLWTAFGGRARVIIANTEEVTGDVPESLADFAAGDIPPERIAVALPMFGTTATHIAALYAVSGKEATLEWLDRLQERGVQFVDGNSVVRDLVAEGRAAYGLTDTDDACGALARDPNAPLALRFPDQDVGGDQFPPRGTLVVPNTVALVAGGPNPDNAKVLIDYLLSAEIANRLMADGWFQVILRDIPLDAEPCIAIDDLVTLDVDLADVASRIDEATQDMSDRFAR